MARFRKTRNVRRRTSIKAKMILLLLLFVFFFCYSEAAIRSTVDIVTSHQAKLLAEQILNDAFEKALNGKQYSYDQLVHLERSAQGEVTSMEVDTQQVNLLKTQLTGNIVKQLEQLEVQSVYIPLGSLTGNDILGARGPKIEFKLYPSGDFTGKIVSQFDSAGINQTRHRILFQASVSMVCTAPFYQLKVKSQADFVVAETIVVGEVPEYYTQVIGEDTYPLNQAQSFQGAMLGAGNNSSKKGEN